MCKPNCVSNRLTKNCNTVLASMWCQWYHCSCCTLVIWKPNSNFESMLLSIFQINQHDTVRCWALAASALFIAAFCVAIQRRHGHRRQNSKEGPDTGYGPPADFCCLWLFTNFYVEGAHFDPILYNYIHIITISINCVYVIMYSMYMIFDITLRSHRAIVPGFRSWWIGPQEPVVTLWISECISGLDLGISLLVHP